MKRWHSQAWTKQYHPCTNIMRLFHFFFFFYCLPVAFPQVTNNNLNIKWLRFSFFPIVSHLKKQLLSHQVTEFYKEANLSMAGGAGLLKVQHNAMKSIECKGGIPLQKRRLLISPLGQWPDSLRRRASTWIHCTNATTSAHVHLATRLQQRVSAKIFRHSVTGNSLSRWDSAQALPHLWAVLHGYNSH